MSSGTQQIMTMMAANTHNMANANTTGFRQDLMQFRSQPVYGEGMPTRVYSMTERGGVDMSHGAIKTTGRDLDFALKGNGWIAVQRDDGSEGYTRAGDLRVSASGLLENGMKLQIMGNKGPIAIPPAEKIDVGDDGTITIIPLGQDAANMVVIDRIKLVNPPEAKLRKGNDGLMQLPDGAIAPPDAAVRLIPKALEGSNVNTVTALVNMIQLSRQYEMQTKMMKNAKENDTKSANLMKFT